MLRTALLCGMLGCAQVAAAQEPSVEEREPTAATEPTTEPTDDGPDEAARATSTEATDAAASGADTKLEGRRFLAFVRVPSPRPAFSLLRSLLRGGVRNLEAELLFGYEWDVQEVSAAQAPRTRFERMNFTERLHFANRGFIFDPRLFNFRLGTTLGLFQEQFSTTGQDTSSEGNLLGFDVSGVFLENKPYPLTVFGNRSEDVVTREFAGTSKVLLESYGGSWTLRETPLRSLLSMRREHVQQRLGFGARSTKREETRSVASYQGTRLGEVTDIDVNYEFDDVGDEVAPDLSFRTHDAGASYRVLFGPYLEKDLVSRVRLFNRQGRVDTLFTQTDQNLRIDHTETLASSWDYTFVLNKVSDTRSLAHAGGAGLQHRLFGSLTTNARGVANFSEVEDGQTLGYGGNLSVNYSKRIPFEGRFSAGGSGAYRIDNQRFPSGETFVFQERHTVQDFQPLFLNSARVIEDSIFLTDESGTIAFEKGFDYSVMQIGQLTAVEPLPGGRLQDGQVILIDYRFLTAPDLDFSTLTRGFNLAVDYDWVSLFFERQQSEQRLLSGTDETFLDDVTDQAGGGQLRWSRPRVHASALGEYRTYDSKRVAYRSPRFVQSLTALPSRRVSVTATLSESFFNFSKPKDRETGSMLGRLSATWRPVPNLYLDSFASYLRLDDTVAPDERLFDAGVRLQWEYGRLRVVPAAAFARRETGASESTEFRFTLTLIRKLL